MKKLDRLTLQVPMKSSWGIFDQVIPVFYDFAILPVGYDAHHPIGTGPFKFGSFTPGQQMTLTRNDNYFVKGRPYFDGIVVTNYPDETSQVNAITAQEEDVVNALTGTSAAALMAAGVGVVISDSAAFNPFCMRVDRPPFQDVRVRQAFRLLVDRAQMRELVFDGHGQIGNDLYSRLDPVYDQSIPQRTTDVDQAKFLLKQAGQEGMTVNLVTSPIGAGVVQQSEVFAQQAAAAGVKVVVQNVPPSSYFGPDFLTYDFGMDSWAYQGWYEQTRLSQIYNPPLYNETHFNDPHFTSLFQQGTATTDVALRAELAHEMQEILWNTGGYIIPVDVPIISGYLKNVNGALPNEVGLDFNFFQQFATMWFS
jgi:peptide/nickel transport system substrate-binding protein